jgi:type I restriction enzyme S subunit
LEESARLLYKEWFVHLRFPGHEHVKVVDGVPEGWEQTIASEIIAINPQTKAEKNKEIWYVPMAALSETDMTVNTSYFERRTQHTNVKFTKNDVLLARITPCLENGKTGFASFLEEGEIACGSTEFIVLRGERVSPAFTYCLARSYPFRENAIKSMIGSSGRQRVQSSCFDKYIVPLPPKSLLMSFDEVANKNFAQVKVLMEQNKKLGQARDLLLPKLMSGEIVV